MKKNLLLFALSLLAACGKKENLYSDIEGTYQAQIHQHSYWISNMSEQGESDTDYVAAVHVAQVKTGNLKVTFPATDGSKINVEMELSQNTQDSLIFSFSFNDQVYNSSSSTFRFNKAGRNFLLNHTASYRSTAWNTITYTLEAHR